MQALTWYRHVLPRSQVVAFRLRRTPLQPRGGSKSHLVVPVDVGNLGFRDFLLDSGSSSVLITAEMRAELGVSPVAGRFMNGGGSKPSDVALAWNCGTVRVVASCHIRGPYGILHATCNLCLPVSVNVQVLIVPE